MENDAESDKSRKWAAFAINDTLNLSTAGTVYDEPNSKHFRNYVEYIKKNKYSDEIPEQFIPLNPPPVPMINNDDEDLNFARNFEDATNYILFAAVACQRLRVNEEVTRRSKLRWFGIFADLYDQYRSIVNTMPELINN